MERNGAWLSMIPLQSIGRVLAVTCIALMAGQVVQGLSAQKAPAAFGALPAVTAP